MLQAARGLLGGERCVGWWRHSLNLLFWDYPLECNPPPPYWVVNGTAHFLYIRDTCSLVAKALSILLSGPRKWKMSPDLHQKVKIWVFRVLRSMQIRCSRAIHHDCQRLAFSHPKSFTFKLDQMCAKTSLLYLLNHPTNQWIQSLSPNKILPF